MSNDTTEVPVDEVPVDEVPMPDELPSVDGKVGANPADHNEMITLPLTNGDMGFISDMLAGAVTPSCLVHVGNFMNSFLDKVTAYQGKLQEIEAEQNKEYMALGKEFFVLDAQGRPTKPAEGEPFVLVEGKTQDDLKDYHTRANNITSHYTQKKNDVANEIQTFTVSHDVLWNFKHHFLNNINIDQAQKNMGIKPETSGNFVAILYSISQKVTAL